jgi:hypothetical protein
MKKRIVSFSIIVCLLMTVFACARTVGPQADGVPQTPDVSQAPEIVSFSDPVLEARIRESMGKPEGTITVQEAEEVLSLDLSGAKNGSQSDEPSITDIDSLKYFKNVFRLDLSSNAIEEASVLCRN